VSHA